MRHLPLIVWIACSCWTLPQAAFAQDWVKAMFGKTDHDFGTVPRGAKTEFRFVFENKYEEDIHVSSIRTSCGCTIPRIDEDQRTRKTYQKGEIVCEFNTQSFIGAKSAVVTVVFDKPSYGEMQLNVRGNIRSDIETIPGEIQFGEVPIGTEKKTTVGISYRGRSAWKIEDVRSTNKHLGVQLKQLSDTIGNVRYEMTVRLKPDAPRGVLNDEIVLVTNEPSSNLVTVPVRATVVPPLVVKDIHSIGSVETGQTANARVVIKSSQAFEIKNIICDDKRFSIRVPQGSRRAHLIPVEFLADDQIGLFEVVMEIETDLESDSKATTRLRGNIKK